MLSFVIMAGCAASKTKTLPVAYRCDKPDLRGPTWADVAILSVEQSSAIDVCNIRNGVDVYERSPKATKKDIPVPSPVECGDVGVQVPWDRPATGIIVGEQPMAPGTAFKVCGEGHIGCAEKRGNGTYVIYYEPTSWVRQHEICHAVYDTTQHTLAYLATRVPE